ncbi:MAG: carbon-nitrogen hydrolase family protein [Pseudomonadota bacterium]
MSEADKLVVAAVQMECVNGDIRRNLSRAEPLVAQAKAAGAELILLPEFMPGGYDLSAAAWRSAEPPDGPTVQWLHRQARQHSAWVATTFLEARGPDFYNTFVLMPPDGSGPLRVRKSAPAAIEAFVFRGHADDRVLATSLGRVGVSICYEGFLTSTARALAAGEPDILLMPHSAPTPTRSPAVNAADIDEYNTAIRNAAADTAKLLGVPAVMANKVGAWKLHSYWPFPDEDSSFPGGSAIADAGGRVVARLDDDEGVIVAEVGLNRGAKTKPALADRGKWVRKPPRLFRYFVFAETAGRLRYHVSRKRRRTAAAIGPLV